MRLVFLDSATPQDRQEFKHYIKMFSEYWHAVMEVAGQVLQSSASVNALELEAIIKQSQQVCTQ